MEIITRIERRSRWLLERKLAVLEEPAARAGRTTICRGVWSRLEFGGEASASQRP